MQSLLLTAAISIGISSTAYAGILLGELRGDVEPWVHFDVVYDATGDVITGRVNVALGGGSYSTPESWGATGHVSAPDDFELSINSFQYDRPIAEVVNLTPSTVNMRSRDYAVMPVSLLTSMPGDANRDGNFDSTDLVAMFQAGTYDNPRRLSGWIQGDFNYDWRFDSSDLIMAMQTGAYQSTAAAAVPEPTAAILAIAGVLLFAFAPMHGKLRDV